MAQGDPLAWEQLAGTATAVWFPAEVQRKHWFHPFKLQAVHASPEKGLAAAWAQHVCAHSAVVLIELCSLALLHQGLHSAWEVFGQ